jgi:hypothetical protein
MEIKTIIKFSLIHFCILTFVIVLRLYEVENGDMGTVSLGTFIYMPYLLCLTILNSTLLTLGLYYFKTSLSKWFAAPLTLLVLITWYLIMGGKIKIHFWKVKQTEFLTLNLIVLLINLATVYFVSNRLEERET